MRLITEAMVLKHLKATRRCSVSVEILVVPYVNAMV